MISSVSTALSMAVWIEQYGSASDPLPGPGQSPVCRLVCRGHAENDHDDADHRGATRLYHRQTLDAFVEAELSGLQLIRSAKSPCKDADQSF
jgi:hypothetical protein